MITIINNFFFIAFKPCITKKEVKIINIINYKFRKMLMYTQYSNSGNFILNTSCDMKYMYIIDKWGQDTRNQRDVGVQILTCRSFQINIVR